MSKNVYTTIAELKAKLNGEESITKEDVDTAAEAARATSRVDDMVLYVEIKKRYQGTQSQE